MALKGELLGLAPKRNELTPIQRFRLESAMHDRFSKEGLRVYFLLNGANTIQQVLEQTGIDEQRMLAVLKFLVDNAALDIRDSLLEEASLDEEAPTAPKKLAVASEKAGVMPTLRSASEKKIYDRFGMNGVEAYRLMDTVNTPGEILDHIEMTEDELLEILDFLHSEGLISLEKAAEKPEAPEPEEGPPAVGEGNEEPPEASEELPEEKPEPPPKLLAKPKPKPLAPMPEIDVEAKPLTLPGKEEPGERLPALPLFVPSKKALGLFGKLKTEAALLRSYGQKGMHLYGLIDGDKTTLKLAKETKYGLKFIDEVLNFLCGEGALDMKQLGEQDIKEKYGEEGVAIYDVYGREGLIIYELIDKKATIKEIILASGVPPRKGVEIFAFIHKILGVDIAFNAQAILRQLGVEE